MLIGIKHYLSDHLTIKSIGGSIIGAFMLAFGLLGLLHIYEFITPSVLWFNYKAVTPVKNIFVLGENPAFLTQVRRYQKINMQWQDTAYCKIDSGYDHKLVTQYRPQQGTQLMAPGYKESVREYTQLIDTKYSTCRMCGSAIGTTSLGYTKTYSYCTKYFTVNTTNKG